MNIFIPYGGRTDWGEELRYALRSLDSFFEPFNLTVYSTATPEWLIGCKSLDIERFYPSRLEKKYGCRKYEHWFDSMNKLRVYAESETEERFIYTYDDILLLRDASAKDIVPYPQEEIVQRHKLRFSRSRHGETILSALNKCDRGLLFNYETHTPRIYETEKLRELFTKFPLEKEIIPYSIATLYFNYYDHEIHEEIALVDNYKVGFYGKPGGGGYSSSSMEEVKNAVNGKMWLNYSFSGLMARDGNGKTNLKTWIIDNFKTKSKYEGCINNN